MTNRELWQRLASFSFDVPGAAFTFTDRLAKENLWSQGFARQVCEEYRRFLYLCVTAGHPVTPSEEVDAAWHLHLLYTHSYWQDLCQDTLQKEIHHGPTQGGEAEDTKHRDWYARTLASYEKEFGQPAPAAIWPPADKRFAGDIRPVDISRNFVLRRRTVYLSGLVTTSSLALASCSDGEGSLLIWAFFIVVLFIGIIKMGAGRGGGGGKGGGFGGGCGSSCGSSCGGGCGGGGD
ncbi:glycine-rich domain-containing protein [Roseibacillus ishigakijimensis]|uniref:TIGR04222 domain-containing protein n=1 Tax=Roseibacillus ishigakijimensis TaxID=454146 RepID=A0A934VML8_9BACT|nr:hypothetical protein [Roseibacillus ishigakijimensis]MBK1834226.1 hypothetical protein [Roseibacillus ishigakijimensis]